MPLHSVLKKNNISCQLNLTPKTTHMGVTKYEINNHLRFF